MSKCLAPLQCANTTRSHRSFPIYHDLVPANKGIEEMTEAIKEPFKSIKVAQRSLRRKNIPTKGQWRCSPTWVATVEEFVYDFAEELEELNADSSNNEQVAFVTLFMQYRAEAQISGKKKWEKLSDWTVEDTKPCRGVMSEISSSSSGT